MTDKTDEDLICLIKELEGVCDRYANPDRRTRDDLKAARAALNARRRA